MSIDTDQQSEDWDRQIRFKREKDVRTKLSKLNKQENRIDSVKFDLKKGIEY